MDCVPLNKDRSLKTENRVKDLIGKGDWATFMKSKLRINKTLPPSLGD